MKSKNALITALITESASQMDFVNAARDFQEKTARRKNANMTALAMEFAIHKLAPANVT